MSLVLRIEFVTGVYGASTPSPLKNRAEWPPHPSRLFSAFVAAAQAHGDRFDETLRWLETLPPPTLLFGAGKEATLVEQYVPRGDHDRCFFPPDKTALFAPTFVPDNPVGWFVWEGVDVPPEHAEALRHLCDHVAYLGRASSHVSITVEEEARPDPAFDRWVPSENGDEEIRVVEEGRLDYLRLLHASDVRPDESPVAFYQKNPERPKARTPYRRPLIFEVKGLPLDLADTGQVVEVFRKAIFSRFGTDIPESISGHKPDGTPTDQPHMAVGVIADVGHVYAEGHLMGVSVMVPRGMDQSEYARLHAALHQIDHLTLGKRGTVEVRVPLITPRTPKAFKGSSWTRPSKRWGTYTPFVGGVDYLNPEDVARACKRAGLPKPARIWMSHISPHMGVPTAREFGRYRGRNNRMRHIEILFDEPVQGPLILGNGRFFGFGHFKPLNDNTPERKAA